MNEYKDSLIDKIENVPTEKLIEPKISLIGPALEASKYYIEEKELREMFANLVANSINSEKTNFVHHAFVEIIKQLSPLDANNLELFDGFSTLPIVQIQYVTPGGSLMLNDNVFLGSDTTLTNVDENSTSITNLSRLGLVNIDYSNHVNLDYSLFTNSKIFQDYKERFFSTSLSHEHNQSPVHDDYLDIRKGKVRISPLGSSFIKACVSQLN